MNNPSLCSCGGVAGVKDVRPTPGAVRRRRQCARCQRSTTTYEISIPQLGDAVLVRRVAGGLTFQTVKPRTAVVIDVEGGRTRGKR